MVAFISNPLTKPLVKKSNSYGKRQFRVVQSHDLDHVGHHSMYLNTFEISSNAIIASSSPASFDAIAPDVTVLYGIGITFAVCVVAGWVWANQVVPVSRTKLAISKRSGAVREYLDTLNDNESTVEQQVQTIDTFNGISSMLIDAKDTETESTTKPVNTKIKDDKAFERWLFTDWLEKDSKKVKGGRQKEPAIPILKNAKWNSGDNPVLAATALILIGVTISSTVERVFSII